MSGLKTDLVRFSVAMPEDLLMRFDAYVARRGIGVNRSEAVRDLVRDALVEEETALPGVEVMGTLTIVFNHHASDVQEKLHTIQHSRFGMIVSTTHVHLDEDTCLEVIILRGETIDVRDISDQILGTKGVRNGGLVITTTGKMV
jgi:CopG family nickel-responsive transcriptional regulator